MGELTLKIKEKEPDPVYNDCDNTFTYTGNGVFPLIKSVNLSKEERSFFITFSTIDKPIKIKVYLNDVKIYTSSYIGNIANQSALNSYNIDNNLPLEEISNVLTFTAEIDKAPTDRNIKIEIYAPLTTNDLIVGIACEL